ncbi:hypothetical protein ABH920_003235 [Catenulispora sp. EB89]|uniref:hypothetical protein n=1 Tax=Catenulispora sp. EB89 TaxID=3156257 RepID=UPI003518F7E0
MRTLRLLLAVGLSLAPALAATAAGTTPAFAGGGAGMTLTATMDGQDQRLLAGTKHMVHITLADTPGEADLRDITISLKDLDPRPLRVDCPGGQNGHLSLEPNQSLQCTSLVTAAVGYRTLVARASAYVPSEGGLVRTDPLHYDGFMPPPPPPPPASVLHAPLAPDPASGRPPRAPVFMPPPPLDPPDPADPPGPASGDPGKAPPAPTAPVGSVVPVARGGCLSGSGADGGCCSGNAAASGACCAGHAAAGNNRCCGPTGKSGSCAKHDGLAFTGMSTPMLAGAASVGLLLVAGGFILVRRSARR